VRQLFLLNADFVFQLVDAPQQLRGVAILPPQIGDVISDALVRMMRARLPAQRKKIGVFLPDMPLELNPQTLDFPRKLDRLWRTLAASIRDVVGDLLGAAKVVLQAFVVPLFDSVDELAKGPAGAWL